MKQENETELRTIYDSRASFYKKAYTRYEGDKLILRSYDTDVAFIENNKPVVESTYSSTTLRHIKEFLKQNGHVAETSKQILEDYKISPDQEQKIKEENQEREKSMLKSIKMVASMGEIFCDNQKDKNDWKVRMLKAGLENKGLSVPEDWGTLSEDEKETRLNNVLSVA